MSKAIFDLERVAGTLPAIAAWRDRLDAHTLTDMPRAMDLQRGFAFSTRRYPRARWHQVEPPRRNCSSPYGPEPARHRIRPMRTHPPIRTRRVYTIARREIMRILRHLGPTLLRRAPDSAVLPDFPQLDRSRSKHGRYTTGCIGRALSEVAHPESLRDISSSFSREILQAIERCRSPAEWSSWCYVAGAVLRGRLFGSSARHRVCSAVRGAPVVMLSPLLVATIFSLPARQRGLRECRRRRDVPLHLPRDLSRRRFYSERCCRVGSARRCKPVFYSPRSATVARHEHVPLGLPTADDRLVVVLGALSLCCSSADRLRSEYDLNALGS